MMQNTCWILETVLLQTWFWTSHSAKERMIYWFKSLGPFIIFFPMLLSSMGMELWFMPISVPAGIAPEPNLCMRIYFMFLEHVEDFGLLSSKNCFAKATFENWFWMISKQVLFDSPGGCKFKLADVTQGRISLDIIRAVSCNVNS